MGPPTFIRMDVYQLHHDVRYDHNGLPVKPPPDCAESLIPATDDLSLHFICVPWLFRVHPPTREEELGRVLRTTGADGEERVRAQKDSRSRAANTPHPTSTHYSAERDCDDGISGGLVGGEGSARVGALEDRGSSPLPSAPAPYPYPATAVSCNDPRWPESVAAARHRARQLWRPMRNQLCPIGEGPLPVGVDVSKEEMAWIQEYLPRDHLRFVKTEHGWDDMRSRLQEVNNRKACLVLNNISTGGKSFMFVFDVSTPFCQLSGVLIINHYLGRISSFWTRDSA
jgi:hypothetical protein